MLSYLVKRLAAALLTVLLAETFAFFALRVAPGDAIEAQLARSGASLAQIAARRAELGLDQPLLIQYLRSLLNPGVSLSSQRPVSQIIAEQIGPTLALAATALTIAVGLGLNLGLIVAFNQSLLGGLARFVSALALAAPVYWTGTLAILIFSVGLRVLPSAGGGDFAHLILPALVLGLSLSGAIAQVTAASLRSTLEQDFIRTARAKGLRPQQVWIDHAVRASLPPILAVIALQAGFLIGGAAITEALFVRQGVGGLLLTAIRDKDYPVVQGVVSLSAVGYSLVELLADLLTAVLDARVQAA